MHEFSRLPEQLDVLVVHKSGAKHPATYKDFRVRKQKVLDLLCSLKQHNLFYASVSIRPLSEVDLPVDGDILDRLPHVSSGSGHPSSVDASADLSSAPSDELQLASLFIINLF